jgi:hypothetical protein
MNNKKITLLLILFFSNYTIAQSDLIFKANFEILKTLINDTGITWAGESPSGNNSDCTSTTITSPQDCNQGRDYTHNDDSDGLAGFSYTKLDANGAPLLDQSVSYDVTPWICVKDNVTGLVWEVKTTTIGIHHKDNTYKWGGLSAIGLNHPDAIGTYYSDWDSLVEGSNTENLCGFNNWRVPTVSEFTSITNKGLIDPAIDVNYFPNTVLAFYWSSSPAAGEFYSWVVDSYTGSDTGNGRGFAERVRLVRSE